MVLKDKIEKTHRKGYYFKAKKIGIFVSLFSIVSAFIIIPTYIAINNHQQEIDSKADNEQEETPTKEEVEPLLNY